MSAPTIDGVIAAIVKLRNTKANIQADANTKVKEINNSIDKLEAFIKAESDRTGVTSFKTAHGTAFLSTSDYANVANWDEVLRFIQENQAYDLLERRVNKQAVRGYMDSLKYVPPGINYGTSVEVNVRKPTAKD
jgi:hypothetical protein